MPQRAMRRTGTTRERILATAAELFARDGYKATNLLLVAEELGITRQALYYHFPSKGDILAALVSELRLRIEEKIASVPKSPDTYFLDMFLAHIEVVLENVDLFAVFQREASEIAQLPQTDAGQWTRQYMNTFIDAYKLGVRAGNLRRIDSRAATNVLINSANAIPVWYRDTNRHNIDSSGAAKFVFDILVRGVVKTVDGS
ncbi:TetR/AcrR family transcriptional regulator [Rhodococcus sp. WS4]|nr:TetR/AcrR family transcriptional regulator [Rhodococcus sp. WS4]